MAFLNETFNTADLPENTGGNFEPLPAGWYTAVVASAELKDTKAGTGQYIAVRYDITGPTHQGRVVFGNLNIRNPNPKAEEIGRAQLGEMMRAIGLASVQDTDQLVGGSCSVKLTVKMDEQYGASNEIKGWKSASGSPAPSASSSPAASAPAASSPPWAKK